MFPEIVAAARDLKLREAILDGEAIGYNPKTGRFASFQETVQRKRKHEVAEFAKKIPLSAFVLTCFTAMANHWLTFRLKKGEFFYRGCFLNREGQSASPRTAKPMTLR